MKTIIFHNGINTKYSFDTWEEAQEYLEKHHQGLSSGMLANCVEIEINQPLIDLLESSHFENDGEEFGNTKIEIIQQCNSEPNTDWEYCDDIEKVEKFIGKYEEGRYWTDPVGNPTLIMGWDW